MASTNGNAGYGTPQRDTASNGTPPDQTPASGPPSDYVPVTNGRKRKADGTSSRGVANLTPEQLAKKRANDREAQRAIRERTRNQIETLERRIKELESQQPFQELQNALRQREQIQAENDDLKRRMQSIFALLQPIASAQGLNDLAAATAQQSPLPMPPPPQAHMYHAPQPPPYDQPPAPFAQHHLHPDLRNQQPPPQQPQPQPMRGQHSPATAARYAQAAQAAAQLPADRRWSPQQPYHSQLAPAPQQSEAERHGLNYLLDERKMQHQQQQQQRELLPAPTTNNNETPLYARLPLNTEPTCALDSSLLDFEAERRRAAAQGTPSSTLVGPAYPSISSLLNPDKATKSHPLSKLFTDVLSSFPAISDRPEQVASLYMMFLNMRWRIAPTQENYERLPEWIRPIRSQIELAHPAWFDTVPWPSMRERMNKNPSAYPFEHFSPLYCTTFSLNWPYDPQQCLLPKNQSALTAQSAEGTSSAVLDEDEEFMINPVFESHLRNLNNWSLGPTFANAFPDLAENIRIKEK